MATFLTKAPAPAVSTATLIELARVEKVYRNGKLEYPALRGVDLSIAAGELVAIVGPSGSRKSTIINMITGIDRPTAGTVSVAISMFALINTLAMVVLERTREIGILRCIGAHARDVRRIFATEGLTVASAGWLIGIPLGLAHAVVTLAENVFTEHVLFTFPGPERPDRADRHSHPRPAGYADPATPRRALQARRSAQIRVRRGWATPHTITSVCRRRRVQPRWLSPQSSLWCFAAAPRRGRRR